MNTPYAIEIPYQDPCNLFAPHAQQSFAQFLDSAMVDENQGRYSYIALSPLETLCDPQNAFDKIKEKLATHPCQRLKDKPPFQGGYLGYIGYEFAHQIEKLPVQPTDPFTTPDICFGFYDTVAAFDHLKKRAWIFSLTSEERAHDLHNQLSTETTPSPYRPIRTDWKSDFTQNSYEQTVQRVIDYIRAGDIFQANLTQRFTTEIPQDFDRFAFYQNLRRINPAPFSAYLNFDGFTVASSSPERFLQLNNQQVETCPIKGTRPRHTNTDEDQAQALTLKNSEKDRAENTMIVDLLRNDLSKVCTPHSVVVPELCEVHSFASVHHLISTVLGQLREEYNAVDLLHACFPGGSITGAPKVRAMEIIAELEPCRRNTYCGAIGYIGMDGSMDTNIVIRTLIFKEGAACAQVGGGIVADSDPQAEYQETLDKAQALFKAFTEVAP
ncbi:MAG: aminodeoxychorismate synthase component I [Methylocystaceae bacterium]|nr:aminodeoxychorismate synthase component I [Methylocystaceae bacterium]